MTELKEIQREMLQLSLDERLRLAHWLLSTVVDPATGNQTSSAEAEHPNPLLAVAGRFSGGPGNTAARAEEILEQEVQSHRGLSRRK